MIAFDDITRVAGRVHALVMRRAPAAEIRARRYLSAASHARPKPDPSATRRITPRITRRAAPLLLMTNCVSAVGCMRLLGGDPRLKERGARNDRDPQAAAQTGELNHAARANRNCFLL